MQGTLTAYRRDTAVCGRRMVQESTLLTFHVLCKGFSCVQVEAKEGDCYDLVKHQSTDHKQDEPEQLKQVELLTLSVDFHCHEEQPDQQCPCRVNGCTLGRRCVLGDCNSKAIEKGHREANKHTVDD